MIKNKISSYIQYFKANNIYWWAMPQKLPVGGFEWEEDILIINKKPEKFIKVLK